MFKQINILFYLLVAAFCFIANVQGQSPGGINGHKIWLKNDDEINHTFSGDFNYNNSLELNLINSEKIDLSTINKMSFFVVYQGENKSDPIFNFSFADHKLSLYGNQILSKKLYSYDSTFTKSKFVSLLESSLGRSNNKNKFKQNNFVINQLDPNAKIAELIIFDRLISKQQRRRIDSYFSVKYGISLPLNSDYMNSKGNIVWDHNENQDFKYRVTAIGRDDLSGLYQSQSSNTYSDFKFTIGVQSSEDNNTDLKNGEFFFWSDNNKSIEIKKPTDSTSVILLERKWKYIHVEPFDKKLQFNFTLNSNVFDSVDLTKYSSALAFYSNISDFKSNNITRLIPMEQRTTDYWQTILALNKDNVQGYFGIALIPNNSDYLPIVKFSCPERQVSIKTPKLMYVDNCKVNNSIGDEILKIDDLKGLNEINLKDLPKGKNILSLFSGEIKVWEKEIYIDYKNCGNTSNYSVSVKAQPSPASVHEIVNFKIIGENIQSNEEYQLYMYSMDGKVVDILRGTLKNGNEVLTKVFQLPGIFKYTLIVKNEIVAEGSVVVN